MLLQIFLKQPTRNMLMKNKSRHFWINLYQNGTSMSYGTRKVARECANVWPHELDNGKCIRKALRVSE
jgi:hypothetical protein